MSEIKDPDLARLAQKVEKITQELRAFREELKTKETRSGKDAE